MFNENTVSLVNPAAGQYIRRTAKAERRYVRLTADRHHFHDRRLTVARSFRQSDRPVSQRHVGCPLLSFSPFLPYPSSAARLVGP